MSATKLTLSVNKNAITAAKQFAELHHTSISKLVELYFLHLVQTKKTQKPNISPLVKELSGVISLPKAVDVKKEYRDYLEAKYS